MPIQKMTRPCLLALTALMSLGLGCSDNDSSGTPDAGTVLDLGPADLGPPDLGPPDLGPPDLGPPPCTHDQGDVWEGGCEDGFVCDVETGACVPGVACTSNADCNACSSLTNPVDCGHGFNVTAWCDTTHGNVCTRSRAPCEVCDTDSDCGLVDSIVRRSGNPDAPDPEADVNKCVDYSTLNISGLTGKFCGRPIGQIGCPQGFEPNQTTGQCVLTAGCPAEGELCPRGNSSTCVGTGQICQNESCGGEGDSRCATNDVPGALGFCFNYCTTNDDCPASRPICNTEKGICGAGCTKGSCAGNLVCHMDGFCAPPCNDDNDCTMETTQNGKIYGGGQSYCNQPGRNAPYIYKGGSDQSAYRDDNSCAPLGCERPVDCPGAGIVCDTAGTPPACVRGCYTAEDDCSSGEVCKDGPDGSYTRESCRALPDKSDDSAIGVCCFPGCTNRILQCDLNEFCCAEPGSPYATSDSMTCGREPMSSMGTIMPGECFDMPLDPFCQQPPDADTPCNSGWTYGFNSDQDVMGGTVFQEQEFLFGVAVGMDTVPLCGVTCNPSASDNACPRGWNCGPVTPRCLQDADCGANLECVGEDTTTDPPTAGQCKCGENGVASVTCPQEYALEADRLGVVTYPRCKDPEGDGFGDMVCVAAYNCTGPSDSALYPTDCAPLQ